MDAKTIIKEIENEIMLLHNADYRKQQNVWAEDKQLKNIQRLLKRINIKQKTTVADFCRVMYDSASTTSKIAKLSECLFDLTRGR